MLKKIVYLALVIAMTGCASGRMDYVEPVMHSSNTNIKIIDKPRNQVWDKAVPSLGKEYFVINNLDKSSGLINISYSGDPIKYIDCGKVTAVTTNARGEQKKEFPGAISSVYFGFLINGQWFTAYREMDLEGRVNLIFEEIEENKTKITANTRYVVKRTTQAQPFGGGAAFATKTDSVNFNSNGTGTFPPGDDGRMAKCVSTGELEKSILSVIN